MPSLKPWYRIVIPREDLREGKPLDGLGTAPLDDSLFRSAVFEQLGETRREAAVTTDIIGKKDAHAGRLDKEAEEAVKKGRLHRKVATVIFFESNGGQARAEATVPELRLAVAEPELDVDHVDAVLEALVSSCYYLTGQRNRYRFSLSPNLASCRPNLRFTSLAGFTITSSASPLHNSPGSGSSRITTARLPGMDGALSGAAGRK